MLHKSIIKNTPPTTQAQEHTQHKHRAEKTRDMNFLAALFLITAIYIAIEMVNCAQTLKKIREHQRTNTGYTILYVTRLPPGDGH